MEDDDHYKWELDGINAFYNNPSSDPGSIRSVDLCHYDSKLGKDWPLEIGDSALIHGQIRLHYDKMRSYNENVSFHKLLLVESHVMWENDKKAKGHSVSGRYYMPYFIENKAGKCFKRQREYYDTNPNMFWLKNNWYQQYECPFHRSF